MKQVVLVICDGMGYSPKKEYNAIANANTPNLNYLQNNYPNCLLKASGLDIGLPDGQMGTSEANHLVIGSGRIIYQNLVKINNSINTDTLKNNETLLKVTDHVKDNNSVFHIMGILGPGGVHGHSDHIKALVKAAKYNGVEKISLHLITDGRDTFPKSSIEYLEDIKNYISGFDNVIISSISGRYFAMDRDKNMDRVAKYFNVITKKEFTEENSAEEIINNSYSKDLTDEFIEPVFIKGGFEIKENDGLVFANFRSDRAVEITRMIYDANIKNLKFVTMTNYFDDKDATINIGALFGKEIIDNTLSEIISRNNLKQLKVTETEKFVHLTFFFNAQKYESESGENRIMIESNKDIKTHDQKPEMKAAEISDQVVKAISEEKYSFIATNLVNCDMVGHTGNWEATIKGVEAVDLAIGKIIEEAKKHDAIVLITADHGNAEEKFDPVTNQPITSHSLNPVPFIVFGDEYKEKQILTNPGYLSDIAPTILNMLNLEIPKEMTGNVLIK